MGWLNDIEQDDKIKRLAEKIRRLENKINGGNGMSKIIKDLIGMECTVESDELLEEKCTVLDADEEWVKLTAHGRKKDITKIVRIDSIEAITVD